MHGNTATERICIPLLLILYAATTDYVVHTIQYQQWNYIKSSHLLKFRRWLRRYIYSFKAIARVGRRLLLLLLLLLLFNFIVFMAFCILMESSTLSPMTRNCVPSYTRHAHILHKMLRMVLRTRGKKAKEMPIVSEETTCHRRSVTHSKKRDQVERRSKKRHEPLNYFFSVVVYLVLLVFFVRFFRFANHIHFISFLAKQRKS